MTRRLTCTRTAVGKLRCRAARGRSREDRRRAATATASSVCRHLHPTHRPDTHETIEVPRLRSSLVRSGEARAARGRGAVGRAASCKRLISPGRVTVSSTFVPLWLALAHSARFSPSPQFTQRVAKLRLHREASHTALLLQGQEMALRFFSRARSSWRKGSFPSLVRGRQATGG